LPYLTHSFKNACGRCIEKRDGTSYGKTKNLYWVNRVFSELWRIGNFLGKEKWMRCKENFRQRQWLWEDFTEWRNAVDLAIVFQDNNAELSPTRFFSIVSFHKIKSTQVSSHSVGMNLPHPKPCCCLHCCHDIRREESRSRSRWWWLGSLRRPFKGRKGLFWLRVSDYSHLIPLFGGVCGEAEHHSGDHNPERNCSPHGGPEAKREIGISRDPHISFKGTLQHLVSFYLLRVPQPANSTIRWEPSPQHMSLCGDILDQSGCLAVKTRASFYTVLHGGNFGAESAQPGFIWATFIRHLLCSHSCAKF
jgi:hypothetical protein